MSGASTTEEFWSANQPGFRFTDTAPGTPEFFAAVERQRYRLEPHIPELVNFPRWRDKDVLEVGCGIATDGVNFARAGARYTGIDQSAAALSLASRRFALDGLDASFVESQAHQLPFADESFDFVFSHGVLHHIDNIEHAVAEISRVLRPGGSVLVMVYHRRSFNYLVSIMVVRRALAGLLLVPGASKLIACVTGEAPTVLEGHRVLLRQLGLRYLTDRELFLSHNTDGPGNPLSRAFTRREATRLFRGFRSVAATVRYLNLRIYPMGERLSRTRAANRLATRWGWHLYITGTASHEH
jgi:ubiquinone/menaquinone biosynthesis C-methylase UbiE